jgi:kynurenine formamidase
MIIDLTHTLTEAMPLWPKAKPFNHRLATDYDTHGYRTFLLQQPEGIGTHMDAPAHFIKDGRTISDLSCTELVAPGCIIDVRSQVAQNDDYKISAKDVLEWEKEHGLIPAKALVLGLTGWSQYWFDVKKYQNMDANGVMHFPGWSESAAKLLIERDIVGVGIDTLSIDAAIAIDHIAHHIFLENDKYQLENLANLDKLPAVGMTIIALPMKIQNGAEAPVRAIALKKII